MASTFIGTVGLQIQLETGIPLDAGATVGIRYLKPDVSTGTWAATIDDAPAGLISYTTMAVSDLDVSGTWMLNAVYDPTGAEIYYGETACLIVKALGT